MKKAADKRGSYGWDRGLHRDSTPTCSQPVSQRVNWPCSAIKCVHTLQMCAVTPGMLAAEAHSGRVADILKKTRVTAPPAPRGHGCTESRASLASALSLTGPNSCCVADTVSACHTPRSSNANAGCLCRPALPTAPAAGAEGGSAAAAGMAAVEAPLLLPAAGGGC